MGNSYYIKFKFMTDRKKSLLTNTSRNVMAKKFKINDGTNNFTEANTLLEPANNNASAQNEKEEIKEVSITLA